MKKRVPMISLVLLLVAGVLLVSYAKVTPSPSPRAAPTPTKPTVQVVEKENKYAALNPSGIIPEVELKPLAPRVPDLSGKTVYCVSQHVGNADIFLEKVAKELPKYAPGVRAVYKPKPGVYMSDDPELWDEIAKEADALIYGCAA